MPSLRFENLAWVGTDYGPQEERATTASLRILAGDDPAIEITKVEDRIAQSLRSHINVPLISLANWLVMNWWRLRFEGKPDKPNLEWFQAHRLSCIGDDHAWPALEISSDKDFIHLEMEAEAVPDASAIRYLQPVSLDLPARAFENAVEKFLDHVEARLGSTLPGFSQFRELREELSEERRLAWMARTCRWQALAGFDPGDAPEDWLAAAEALVDEVGAVAGDEVMSVLPSLEQDIAAAKRVIDEMKASSTTVDLTWLSPSTTALPGLPGLPALPTLPALPALPWQRGRELAWELRARFELGRGPLTDGQLSSLLSTSLPLQGPLSRQPLGGGMRNGECGGRTRIVKKGARPESQRFYLARMIGAALVLSPDQHLVPVTDSSTSLQKLQRAFAQEFLCPWRDLDAFTDDHGLDDEALIDAAEHFGVSEWLVRSTLVNCGKVPRDRLPQA